MGTTDRVRRQGRGRGAAGPALCGGLRRQPEGAKPLSLKTLDKPYARTLEPRIPQPIPPPLPVRNTRRNFEP